MRCPFIRRPALIPTLALSLTLGACSGAPDGSDAAATPDAEEATPVPPSNGGVVAGSVPVMAGGLPSVVILMPTTPQEFDPPAWTPAMDQVALTFTPAILLARTGEPVEFWNSDEVLHNVRVMDAVTKDPSFNVAIPTGGKYHHTFTKDAFYEVGCDIHPGMSAVVVATSTPYAAVTSREGEFTIDGVRPGPYKMTVYAGARTIERSVEVSGPETRVSID